MSARQRAAIFVVFGGVWLTGCAWLCLNQFFATRGPFGTTPHPWAPALLSAHAIISILGMYLLGWLSARHIVQWWAARRRRTSGAALSALLVLLVASGFALFFLTSDRGQRVAALSHDLLGLAITVFALQHWFFVHRTPRIPDASRL